MSDLDALRAVPRWGTWHYDGDSKVPDARVNHPEEWGKYSDALARRNGGGLGVLLGDGLAGIDLDNCRDPKTGELHGLAQNVVDKAREIGAYVEVSPSGTGVKIFGRSSRPSLELNYADEGEPTAKLFSGPRYFAVTEKGEGDPTADISWLLEVLTPEEKERSEASPLPEVVSAGGRNETLFREAARFRRQGLSEKEIAAALQAINKERCKPPLASQDVARIAKSAARYEPKSKDAPARTVVLTCAADIKPERVLWLWHKRIAKGMLCLLAGREGLGKSSIALERAARITRGQLEGDSLGTPQSVIVVAAEDSMEHTIVPRLMAAGADLKKVFRANVNVQDVGTFELSLPDDVPALEAAIVEKEVALVILDPIISRLGSRLDTHKDAEVRLALEPIVKLAERTGAAILGIIHVNKTATTDPLNSVMGSRAFSATARGVLLVMRDGDKRLLCFPKNNQAEEQKSVGFRIASKEVAKDDEGKPITTAEVIWTGESDRTAREVLEEQASTRPHTTRDRASAWLSARLKTGPVPAKTLEEEAGNAGIPWRTVQRARQQLGVVIQVSGFPRTSEWSLPTQDADLSVLGRGDL